MSISNIIGNIPILYINLERAKDRKDKIESILNTNNLIKIYTLFISSTYDCLEEYVEYSSILLRCLRPIQKSLCERARAFLLYLQRCDYVYKYCTKDSHEYRGHRRVFAVRFWQDIRSSYIE